MRRECPGVFHSAQEVILGCPKSNRKFRKFRHFFMLEAVFRLFSCSVVVVQWSVFQRNTRVIEHVTWTEKEKALRVPRAVNIG